ncbi:hypothetical protein HPB50_010469 [Hyalomma asiaticum]|uniref:Uncharacterized protein n=1 Tax=Hyalomma asiaticum TaxID=266040 RepID=A0ACB7SV47_HYAAI|nr:hypothetical protein HPB50_010469 [Hyalomma asiaticum]
MGHEAQNCREKEGGPRLFQSVAKIDTRAVDAANEKYFLLAKVNGHDIKAYSQCITIRQEDVDRIGRMFTATNKRLTIGDYGSGRVMLCSEANINVTDDQATADVPVLIMLNESQAIPLIVGQPFTKQPHVIIVRRRNTLRIFEEQINTDENDDTLQSIEIPDISKCPVCLWARESTVVPPNYVELLKLYITGGEPSADVFMDTHLSAGRGRRTYSSVTPVDKLKLWSRDEIDWEGSGNDSSDSNQGSQELHDGRVCTPAHSSSERPVRGSAEGATSDQCTAVT